MIELPYKCVTCLIMLLACCAIALAQDAASSATTDASKGLDAAGADATRYKPFPAPDAGYVTDLADLLSVEQEEELERWLWDVERETTIEIAVLTIRSMRVFPDTSATTIEVFASGVFDAWGVGNMPDNHGVLLVVAADDRRARIELGAGYENQRGLDAADIMTGTIVPHFRKNDYAGGIEAGVTAISREFAGYGYSLNWWLMALIACVPCAAAVGLSLALRGKRGWGWTVISPLANLVWLLPRDTHNNWSGNAGSTGFGGGSGSGFGGGFSGGGGATGSW